MLTRRQMLTGTAAVIGIAILPRMPQLITGLQFRREPGRWEIISGSQEFDRDVAWAYERPHA